MRTIVPGCRRFYHGFFRQAKTNFSETEDIFTLDNYLAMPFVPDKQQCKASV